MNTRRQQEQNLTNRQLITLDLIISEIETNGFPPTVREIRDRLGVNSIRGASIHLDALERKGFIQRSSKARGIKVLRRPETNNAHLQEIRIPLIGQVQAGHPIWAEEHFEKYINVKKSYLKGYQKAFAVRVEGESMIEAGIEPGDIALIHPTESASNGDIVVALIEDSVTLKRFHKVDDFIALLPANPNFKPIIGTEFNIQGKLIGLIKTTDNALGSLEDEASLIPITPLSASDRPQTMLKWVYGTTTH
ncbi:transcriptional repressor LexA [candidate division WWE3 bacterium]|nr:transcriptional repressor LexA [candidate division WWE3 bacterium]